MSTTIYDASQITQRNRDKAIAQRIKQDTDAGKPIIVPQAGYGSYLLGEATNGNITYFKKVQGCTDINLSCNCTGSTTVTTNTPAPAPVPPSGPFRLTYDGNGNTGGVVPARPADYASGTQVTVLGNPVPPNSLVQIGYQFTGWNTAPNGSGTSYVGGDTFTITQDTTLYAQWTPAAPVTLSYSGNGNTTGSVPAIPTNYAYGTTVVVLGNTGSPPLEKTGYQFTGWNTAANGSGTSYVVNNIFNITQNTTLYAQWTSTVALTYYGNGNTNTSVLPPTDTNSPYVVGSTVTVLGNPISPNSLLRTGYQFAGWNTAADGSGTSYIGGNTFVINAATTLYAQWLITGSPRLVYSSNSTRGGTGTAPSSSGTSYPPYNATDIVDNTFTNTNGYTFGGWNTAADGSGTSYPAGSEISMPALGTVTLFAQWINPATTYTLTYDPNGGTGTAPNNPNPTTNIPSNSTSTILGNTGSYSNGSLVFYGWNTAADGSGTSYPAGSTITINSNKTLYAQWVSATPQYLVTYDANGATGGAVPASSTNYPGGVQVPILGQGSLTRPGYAFLGWNSNTNGTGSIYAPGFTFTSKTATLYANWAPGSPVKYCGGGRSGGTAGGLTIDYYFPIAQIVQSSDTITVYTTALLSATQSNYGTGTAPLGITSIASRTVITSTNITINTNTSYLTPANDNNYSQTILNSVANYWPFGASISNITYSAVSERNSSIPTYNTSTKSCLLSGCDLSASVGNVVGGAVTAYSFYNQCFTINFSIGPSTFIANSPTNLFYTASTSSVNWVTAPKDRYPYQNIQDSYNALTAITIIPSGSATYVSPSMPATTVQYNGNGATGGNIPNPQYFTPYTTTPFPYTVPGNIGNGTTSTPTNILTKSTAPNTFKGWNTQADGNGINYGPTALDPANNPTYNGASGSLILYAKWASS